VLVFIAIAVGSFIILASSFLFGHDHDIGFFSMKVLGTMTMGFGAAGAIARQYGADYLASSLIGLGAGIVLAGVMYLILSIIYKQQASSIVQTSSAIGQTGIVQTGIAGDKLGEVSLNVGGQYMTYLAKSSAGREIPKGRTVKVVGLIGSQLVVEETQQ
jgi:membrane-bound ClpP family serine protease